MMEIPKVQILLLVMGIVPGALFYWKIISDVHAALGLMALFVLSRRAMGKEEKARKEQAALKQEEAEREELASAATRGGARKRK